MASKGKKAKEAAKPAVGDFVGVHNVSGVVATAPTTLCNDHEYDNGQCRHCSKPIELEAATGDAEIDEATGDAEIDEARQSEKRAEDDGPSHEPAGYQGMIGIQQPWLDRAVTLARLERVSVPELIERLIKRQWIASGAGKGKR